MLRTSRYWWFHIVLCSCWQSKGNAPCVAIIGRQQNYNPCHRINLCGFNLLRTDPRGVSECVLIITLDAFILCQVRKRDPYLWTLPHRAHAGVFWDSWTRFHLDPQVVDESQILNIHAPAGAGSLLQSTLSGIVQPIKSTSIKLCVVRYIETYLWQILIHVYLLLGHCTLKQFDRLDIKTTYLYSQCSQSAPLYLIAREQQVWL